MELRNNGLLEKHVVDVLKEKKLTITTAESCTGGMISSRIVNVPENWNCVCRCRIMFIIRICVFL